MIYDYDFMMDFILYTPWFCFIYIEVEILGITLGLLFLLLTKIFNVIRYFGMLCLYPKCL